MKRSRILLWDPKCGRSDFQEFPAVTYARQEIQGTVDFVFALSDRTDLVHVVTKPLGNNLLWLCSCRQTHTPEMKGGMQLIPSAPLTPVLVHSRIQDGSESRR